MTKKKIKESCEHYDKTYTLTVAMEECAELTQCLSKEIRGQGDIGHLEEEIADILICIQDIASLCDIDEKRVQRWVDFKQNRQTQRIRGG